MLSAGLLRKNLWSDVVPFSLIPTSACTPPLQGAALQNLQGTLKYIYYCPYQVITSVWGGSKPEGCLFKQQLQNTQLPRTNQGRVTPNSVEQTFRALLMFINQPMKGKGLTAPDGHLCPSSPLSILRLLLGCRSVHRDLEEMEEREGICLLQVTAAWTCPSFRPGVDWPYYFWDITHTP